jgi:hypothetical protein
MAEGDRTPGGDESHTGPGERDILAARRARRAELGDAALMRRAEAAEATVRTLESHLADLRRRVREAEEEQRRAAEQLAEREHEVRRVKQREYAEQQLRVEAEEQRERLEREQRGELDRLQRRLAAGERHARELAERLEVVRRELSEAEQEAATGHAAARRAEQQLAQREADLARREQELEQQLEGMRRSYALLESIVRELRGLVPRLRGIVAAGGEAGVQGSGPAEAVAGVPASSAARYVRAPAHTLPTREEPTREEPTREEMAEALAAAVARLRARVAAPVEPEQEPEGPEPETQMAASEPKPEPVAQTAEPQVAAPAESVPAVEPSLLPMPTPFTPRVLALSTERKSWLAPAIRRVADGRDAKLAGELICELLPAQRVKRPLSYTLRIEGLGDVQVRIEGERATVRRPSGLVSSTTPVSSSEAERGAFLLEGPAAAFAELAAGGAGRRLAGVKVHGSRRKLRRLLSARRAPLALSDLAESAVQVWPGLLLLALSEAIASEWTSAHSFVLAFAIQGPPSAMLYLQARDGEPLAVTRVRGEAPLSTVNLSERAFMCVLAGAPLPPGEQVLVDGPTEPLELLLEWSDRAQGLPR